MDKYFYRRNLPHLQPPGGIFFVTYLVAGAVPKALVNKLKNKYEQYSVHAPFSKQDQLSRLHFGKFDKMLDQEHQIYWLSQPELAKVVADSWHFWDGRRIELISYCIMPNHVHVVMRLFEFTDKKKTQYLYQLMESVKKYSSRQCNKILKRTGKNFWQYEYYDRFVRDKAELSRIIQYVVNNPVKANLCKSPMDWQWTYVKNEYNEFL